MAGVVGGESTSNRRHETHRLRSGYTCSILWAVVVSSPPQRAELHRLGDRARPLALAAERVLPVTGPFEGLFPGGGVRRGSVVATEGPGATSLTLALVAGASQAGVWTVAVGVPALGLAAAAELGVDLERLVVVPPPPVAQWSTVVAALVDAFEVLVVRPEARVRPTDARRLVARARERGAVLYHLPSRRAGAWPEAPDLRCTVVAASWSGLGRDATGSGHLRSRQVTVEVAGRREAARPRRAALWLPGPNGGVTPAGRPAPVPTPVGAPVAETAPPMVESA